LLVLVVHRIVFNGCFVARKEGIYTIVDVGEFGSFLWRTVASECIKSQSDHQSNA
jgi:hypothetical protein